MLAPRLIQLIETHADSLTQEAVQEILINERTASFRTIPRDQLEDRVHALYQNLGKWIGNHNEEDIRQEYEQWGRTRLHQGVPLCEIIQSLILTKQHLRRFIREHGLIAFSGDRISHGEAVPLHLYAVQELNYMVGDFFDKALYYLSYGYEKEGSAKHAAA